LTLNNRESGQTRVVNPRESVGQSVPRFNKRACATNNSSKTFKQ